MAKHRWCHKPFVRLSMLSRPLHGKILQFRLPVRLKQLSARIFFPLRQSVSSLSLEMGLEYRDHAYQLLLLRRTTPSSMNNAFLREIDMQITKCTYVHVPFSISLSLFLSFSLSFSLSLSLSMSFSLSLFVCRQRPVRIWVSRKRISLFFSVTDPSIDQKDEQYHVDYSVRTERVT